MRDKIHPDYREVIFKDTAANFAFMSRSTVKTKDTIQWTDGKTYPLIKLDISSASHPFFTGKMKLLDSAGQIDRFNKRFANFNKKQEEAKK
jgi:large subunit ribosomal protein L31